VVPINADMDAMPQLIAVVKKTGRLDTIRVEAFRGIADAFESNGYVPIISTNNRAAENACGES
jgi:hypothetical protein